MKNAEARSRVSVQQVGQTVSPNPSQNLPFWRRAHPYKPCPSFERGFVDPKKEKTYLNLLWKIRQRELLYF